MSLKQTYPKKKLKGNYDTRPKKKKKETHCMRKMRLMRLVIYMGLELWTSLTSENQWISWTNDK